MLYYWYKFIKILFLKRFQKPVKYNETITKTFRVKLFDSDVLGYMAAYKYSSYMDLIRWGLIVRSSFFQAFKNNKKAFVIASQKVIYKKPLKTWSKFKITMEFGGWDDKWVYHIYKFEQDNMLKAVGVTRIYLRKKDVPSLFKKNAAKAISNHPSNDIPEWIIELFEKDKGISKHVN